MFGDIKTSFFVSETRNLYQSNIDLCSTEKSQRFNLIEQLGNTQKEYPDCVCSAFELRIHRNEAIKAHLDVDGDAPTIGNGEQGNKNVERFKEDGVIFFFHGKFYRNIYGATLSVKKEDCKAELTLNRVLEEEDLPRHINLLTISARLFRDKYEERHFGTFSITLFDLDLISDETSVNTCDAVIGPLRYVVSGSVNATVFEERGK
jgi:hypothetical protein